MEGFLPLSKIKGAGPDKVKVKAFVVVEPSDMWISG
jgi:hypothetical protein